MKFHLKFKVFIQENAFENGVSEIAAILSRPQYVKGGIFYNTSTISMTWNNMKRKYNFFFQNYSEDILFHKDLT